MVKSWMWWPVPTLSALGGLMFLNPEYSSVGDHLSSMYKTQESIPSTAQNDN